MSTPLHSITEPSSSSTSLPAPRAAGRARWVAAPALSALLGAIAFSACDGGNSGAAASASSSSSSSSSGAGGEADAGPADAAEEPAGPSACEQMGLPERAFAAGPYGARRHDVADDFSLELYDGSTWSFKEKWSGCESYVFVPDTLVFSDLNKASIWEKDLSNLIKKSPPNAHYFFVSRASTDAAAKASLDAMAPRIETALMKLATAEDEAHWRERLHLVAKRSGALNNWVGDVLAGIGRAGFAIDRLQQVRGVGYFADVLRYKQALDAAMLWPWESNLAYAAHEAIYFNAEADRQAKLDAQAATVVPMYSGEVLDQGFAEIDIALPTEAELAAFDTMEIDVDMRCPDPDKVEFNNCGAWDYLAYLFVRDEATMENIELGRFITSYHRETRWVMDVTPMMVHLLKGGTRHFRWEWAPPWNMQPTETRLSLRFSNQNKGYRPAEAVYLYSGGAFNAMYNSAYMPKDVPIPADAKRVELMAVITGHGADAATQCSEFCNHQHEFTVNGAKHLKEFVEAGTNTKCMDQMSQGMVPNQGGTWWFGRGGWCPGEQVNPWLVDVTAEVTPGQSATISYQGLLNGAPPPDGSGNIALTSYLVVYK